MALSIHLGDGASLGRAELVGVDRAMKDGSPRTDDRTGAPLYTAQVLVTAEGRAAQLLSVQVASMKSIDLPARSVVRFVGLRAIAYATKRGEVGVFYVADGVEAVPSGPSTAAHAAGGAR